MSEDAPVAHELIGETAWSLLEEAAGQVHHPMRIISFATVDAARHPQARLMVLRGASRELNRLWFHTDEDSAKVRDLRAWPHVCIVAHHPCLGIQLRISGSVVLHQGDATAHDHWQQVQMSLNHACGEPAGREPLPFEDPLLDRIWHHRDEASAAHDRRRFMVLECRIAQIHWLQTIGARSWFGIIEANGVIAEQPRATRSAVAIQP